MTSTASPTGSESPKKQECEEKEEKEESSEATKMAALKTTSAPSASSATKTSFSTTVPLSKKGKVAGDLVWARMKGFSWWPSRIIEPNPDIKPPAAAKHKRHHFCYFFGSDNYGWVEEEKMADYDGNREKLKPAKISANLQAAIDRIEEALVDWKLKRSSDICATATFEDGAAASSSTPPPPPPPLDFDFDDDDDSDTDIFSSNLMTNRNGGGISPRISWRNEDSSGGSEVDFSLNFSAPKRKASSSDTNLDNANGCFSTDTVKREDAPVKTKRARKAPSKFADFAVGGDIRDPPKPPVRTFARKSAAPSSPSTTSASTNSATSTTATSSTADSATTHNSTAIVNLPSPSKTKANDSKGQDGSKASASSKAIKNLDLSMPSSSSISSPSKLRVSPSGLRFGFLGLGALGSALTSSLLKSGHRVSVWNRTSSKCKELVKAGASKATSAAEVVSSSDVTFSCVSDPAALREVIFGNSGALQGMTDGKGYVDMSTVDVETCLEVAEAISSRGGRFLEAPLCGTKEAAKRGTLTLVAAGDKSLYDDCHSCFGAIAKKTFYLGDVGNASKMKSVMNLLDGVMMAGLAEAMALTEQVGLRHQDVMEVLELGNLDCELLREKGREMVEGTFTPSVALKHQQKDLKLAVNLADEHHLPLITAAAANELFKRARAMGYDEHDNSAVYRAAQYNS